MSQNLSASDAKRAARNVGALVAASVVSNGILFAWQLFMTAWLGPALLGIQTTVFGLYAILNPFATSSLGLIAIREVARHPEKIGHYASSLLFSQTVLSGVAYLILVLLAYPITLSHEVLAFAAIAGMSMIIDSFGNIANDLLKAQEEMLITASVEIGQVLLRVSLSVFLLYQGWSLFGIYAATIVVGILRSIVLWGIHWRRKLKIVWPLQWREITLPLLLNAAPLAAAAMLSLGYDHADRILLTRFVSDEAAGFFTLGFLLHFGVIELLSTTVVVAMFPLLSRYYGASNKETFGYLSEALSRFMLIVALPISLIFSIYAAEVIGLISTTDFSASIPILQIYTWYTLLSMIGNVISKAMLIQNRQRFLLTVRAFALIVNIGLNIILLPIYGDPRIAALASVIAEAIVLLSLLATFRAEGFVWRRALLLGLRILLIGALAGAAMLALYGVHWLLGFAAGAFIYLLGLRFGGVFSPEDLDLLYRLVAAMPFGRFVQRLWKRDTVVNF